MARLHAFARPDRQATSSVFRHAMGRCCRFTGMLMLILMASQGLITSCHAEGLVIEALSSSALPGGSGSFDIVLMNTNSSGGTSYDVASNTLDVSLSGPATVSITDVNMDTSAPYIFVESLDQNHGLPLATINTPPTGFTSSDSGDVVNGYPGFQVVAPGQTYGLAHVEYTVSPMSVIGADTIAINSINVGTSLADPNGNLLPFTAVYGTLSIIPEPSTLIQGATAVLLGLGVFGWRRWSAAS